MTLLHYHANKEGSLGAIKLIIEHLTYVDKIYCIAFSNKEQYDWYIGLVNGLKYPPVPPGITFKVSDDFSRMHLILREFTLKIRRRGIFFLNSP